MRSPEAVISEWSAGSAPQGNAQMRREGECQVLLHGARFRERIYKEKTVAYALLLTSAGTCVPLRIKR